MIFFSLRTTLFSLLVAVLFGALCATLSIVLLLIKRCVASLLHLINTALFGAGGIFSPVRDIFIEKEKFLWLHILSEIGAFFKVVLFFASFIVLSYAVLDGEVRVYMLAMTLTSYFLSKHLIISCIIPTVLRIILCMSSFFRACLKEPSRNKNIGK